MEQWRARNPLPDGTVTVALGLVVNGVFAYAFLGLAGRTLGPEANEPLAVLWAMIYLIGPGFFLPFEQEVSRSLANRWAQGLGAGPLVRQAGILAAALAVVLVVISVAIAPFLVDDLFDGEWLLLVGLDLAILGYAAVHVARGMLAGLGRFRGYSAYYMAENTLRFGGGVGARHRRGGGRPARSASWSAWHRRWRWRSPCGARRTWPRPGPPAPWGELTAALGSLLAASVLTAFLLYAGPVAIELLAEPVASRGRPAASSPV